MIAQLARLKGLPRNRSNDAIAAVLLTLLAFGLRIATFGDPNLHVDETFYFYVAEQMHKGATLYIDVWDRKPPGLFALYYLFVGIADDVRSYQIAATLTVSLTAFLIFRMARIFANFQGSLFAGFVYLIMLGPFQGFGGQAPIFFNAFVTGAALIVMRALPRLRAGESPTSLYWAFLLLGLAITIKQTTVFEGAYFGVVCTWITLRARTGTGGLGPPLAWAALGAAPFLICAAIYGVIGHFYEFWQAMVVSNFSKSKPDLLGMLARSITVGTKVLVPSCVATLGLLTPHPAIRSFHHRAVLIGWVIAAVIGFLSVPNFYVHYGLSLLPPLCVLGAAFLARGFMGAAALAGVIWASTIWHNPFGFAYSQASRSALFSLSEAASQHRGGRDLFVYDGPMLVYSMTGMHAASPLAFPMHLNHLIERNVSHLNTTLEVRRTLGRRPGAIILSEVVRNFPANLETRRLVLQYAHENCKKIGEFPSLDSLAVYSIALYGDCRR